MCLETHQTHKICVILITLGGILSKVLLYCIFTGGFEMLPQSNSLK